MLLITTATTTTTQLLSSRSLSATAAVYATALGLRPRDVWVLVKRNDGIEQTTMTRQRNDNFNNVGFVHNGCLYSTVECHSDSVPEITLATPTDNAKSHMLDDADLGKAMPPNASPTLRHNVAMRACLAACQHRDNESTEDGDNNAMVGKSPFAPVGHQSQPTPSPHTDVGRRRCTHPARQCIEAGNDTAAN